MKWIVGLAGWGLVASAQAVTVEKVTWNAQTQLLRVTATYTGNCLEHKFDLQLEGCEMTLPARASAILVDSGLEDRCLGTFRRILQYKMTTLTCRPAFLTVRGTDDSKATVFIK